MNLRIRLLRHGQTAWNQQRRFLGSTDIGLDDDGWSQARDLGRAISGSFDAVYSSPLSRARETASCLADHVTEIAEMREMSQGELEGLLSSEAIERFPAFFLHWKKDPTEVAPPGGETLGACRDRGMRGLSQVASAHDLGAVVAVVTHQLVIASITCTVDGAPLSQWSKYCVGNCAGVTLEWDGVNWTIGRDEEISERN
jgi:broad specificity phosphatase PhoE